MRRATVNVGLPQFNLPLSSCELNRIPFEESFRKCFSKPLCRANWVSFKVKRAKDIIICREWLMIFFCTLSDNVRGSIICREWLLFFSGTLIRMLGSNLETFGNKSWPAAYFWPSGESSNCVRIVRANFVHSVCIFRQERSNGALVRLCSTRRSRRGAALLTSVRTQIVVWKWSENRIIAGSCVLGHTAECTWVERRQAAFGIARNVLPLFAKPFSWIAELGRIVKGFFQWQRFEFTALCRVKRTGIASISFCLCTSRRCEASDYWWFSCLNTFEVVCFFYITRSM